MMQSEAPLYPLLDGQLLCPQLRLEVRGAEHMEGLTTFQ